MERFFYPHSITFHPESELVLSPEESNHACKVLRLKAGDEVRLFNGDGYEYRCRIVSSSAKKTVVTLTAQESGVPEMPVRLTVACAVPRMKRDTWMVQKLTELGVAVLVPLCAARSVVEPGGGRLAKWSALVVEASKQCGRNRLMNIGSVCTVSDVVKAAPVGARKLMLAPGGTPFKTAMESTAPLSELIVAVGPEGGWTMEETACFQEAGWSRVKLGASIMRVETAALAAAAAVRFWCDS